jgi:5'-3' exonuclease
MKIYRFAIIMVLILTLTLSGCNQSEEEQESRLSLIKTTNPNPIKITNKQNENIAANVKQDVKKFNEIFDVAVVQGKKDTLVVYKVKHLNRFRMKQIEKNVTKELEKKYPNENFTVSSDYKIFMEALKLKEQVKDPNYSEIKAEKDLEKIIKLKNEQT